MLILDHKIDRFDTRKTENTDCTHYRWISNRYKIRWCIHLTELYKIQRNLRRRYTSTTHYYQECWV